MTEQIIVIGLLAWVLWQLFKVLRKGDAKQDDEELSRPRTAHEKKKYILRAGPAPDLIDMPEPSTRLLTYRVERHAATARQRLWIQYEDRAGNTTERTIHIYHPIDDEYVFSWCCSKLEPRTFARRSIRKWQLLPERFEFDLVVDQYWEEEGTRDMSEKIPWQRWLDSQPDHISERYR